MAYIYFNTLEEAVDAAIVSSPWAIPVQDRMVLPLAVELFTDAILPEAYRLAELPYSDGKIPLRVGEVIAIMTRQARWEREWVSSYRQAKRVVKRR